MEHVNAVVGGLIWMDGWCLSNLPSGSIKDEDRSLG